MRFIIMAAIVSCQVILSTAHAGPSWNNYFGTHYTVEGWGKSLRAIQYQLVMDGSTSVIPLDTTQLDEIKELSRDVDVLLQLGGPGRSAEVSANYYNFIESDSGQGWRDAVHDWAASVGVYQRRNRIYAQLGNEITASIFSTAVHEWLGDGKTGQDYDPDVIPVFAEYYVAPSVAGINDAAASTGNKISIVLGSITNYSNPQAAEWLSDLLNYQIVGNFAPDLAGKRVYELIDIASIHYLMGIDTDYWYTALDDFRNTWIGQGSIRGVWSTEELGKDAADAGWGLPATARIVSRYMEWAYSNNLSKEETRCFIWGWAIGSNEGRSAGDFMNELLAFTNESNIQVMPIGVEGVGAVGELETHTFQVVGQPKRFAVITPMGGTTTLTQLSLPRSKWSGDIVATAHRYSETDDELITMNSFINGKFYVMEFPVAVTLENRHSMLVTITQQ